ncbi:MAG: hypothetical protein WCV67_02750 [Victivallaceae bacterium]|jgi:hypothetical protein
MNNYSISRGEIELNAELPFKVLLGGSKERSGYLGDIRQEWESDIAGDVLNDQKRIMSAIELMLKPSGGVA